MRQQLPDCVIPKFKGIERKKTPWQLKVFLLTIMATLLACQTVMGSLDDEMDIPEASLPESEPQSNAPLQNEPTSPSGEGQMESCLEGESYHPSEGLCYRNDGSANPLFIALMEGVMENGEDDENLLDEEKVLVTYKIDGDEIFSADFADVSSDLEAYQDDIETHEFVWEYYASMIPRKARSLLTGYIVMTDGLGGTLAAVEQSPEDPEQWMLSVDIADAGDLLDLTFTLIHEYGHLLSLGADQVDIDEYLFYNPDDDDAYYDAEVSCPTYFPGEGCTKSSAYLYQFYLEFWDDIFDEWSEIQYIEDDDEYYEAMDDFYFDYEDEFLTDYSATNPEEDIAESWAFFIIRAKPAGNSLAEEKILFFYQFPELVALRDEIIARTYSRLIRIQ